MTVFNSYSIGTVGVVNGETNVDGSGTLWSGINARPGDDLVLDGHTVIILDVISETELLIDPWPYDTVAPGASYKIVWRSPLRYAGGTAMADVDAMIAKLNAFGPIYDVTTGVTTLPNTTFSDDEFTGALVTPGGIGLQGRLNSQYDHDPAEGLGAVNVKGSYGGGYSLKDGSNFVTFYLEAAGAILNIGFGAEGAVTSKFKFYNNGFLLTSVIATATPVTITAATYSQALTDSSLICNRAGTVTLTLFDPGDCPGLWLHIKTIQAQAVVCSVSGVVPIASDVAGTAILPATDGAWCILQSDGNNWITIARGT
jgi:hypothetical protein